MSRISTGNTAIDMTNQKVDYGKSTLFRFSLLSDIKYIRDNSSATMKPPTSGTSRMSGEGESGTNNAPLQTLDDVKQINELLYNFSISLAKNIRVYSAEQVIEEGESLYSSLLEQSQTITLLQPSEEETLWQSLFVWYTVNSQENLSAAIINILRANAFLKAFSEMHNAKPERTKFGNLEEIEELLTIGTATAEISDDYIPVVPLNTTPPTTQVFTPKQQQSLKKKHLAAISTYQKEKMFATIDKYNEVKNEYQVKKNKAFQEAQEAHNAVIQDILSQSPPDPDPENGVFTPLPALPPFIFSYPEFNREYIQQQPCYTDLNNTLNDVVDNNLICGGIEKVEGYATNIIKKATETFTNNISLDVEETVSFDDYEIVVDKKPAHNSYVMQLVKLLPHHTKHSIVITHFSRNNATLVGNVTGTITIGTDPNTINVSQAQKIFETDEFTGFVVSENALIVANNDEVIFEGTATAENGELSQSFNAILTTDVYYYGPKPQISSQPIALLRTSSTNDGEPGNAQNPVYGIRKIGILDYLRVEQEICCYEPGEVSHIENIMAREFRKKNVRDRQLTEITTEESEETENETSTDTTTTDRHEMQTEISQMLTKEKSQQIGITAGMTASYEASPVKIGVTAGTNLNFSNSSSQTNNFSTAESIGREVTQKATERILKKVSYKRTARMLREHEETNEHGFDNRLSGKHVTGIYRWVNKKYKNTMYNYGKRLQYDFVVPEPAKNFKAWMEEKQKDPAKPTAPVHPASIAGVDVKKFNWDKITKDNFAKIAAEYGADVEEYLTESMNIGKSFGENPQGKFPKNWDEPRDSFKYEIEIPEGYACNGFWGEFNCVIGHKGTGSSDVYPECDIIIDNEHFRMANESKWKLWYTGTTSGIKPELKNNTDMYVTKILPVGISTINMGGFSLNVIAKCELTEAAKNQWQQRTFKKIMDEYNKKLQAYKDALLAIPAPNENVKPIDYNFNPGKGRAIEGRELKRLCIEMMVLPFVDPTNFIFQMNDYDYGRESYTDLCNAGHVLFTDPKFQKHSELVTFLEQAFEWDLMSYQFYQYMYAKRTNWSTLIKQKSSSDPLFEAFLQSGMARVSLTVRPGFEKMVLFFLDKGVVPANKDVIPGGHKYQSIVDSLKLPVKNQVGDPWETIVPTDLVILQSDAQPLQQFGLPCTESCKDEKNPDALNGIAIGSSEMAGIYSSDNLVGQIQNALAATLTHIYNLVQMGNGQNANVHSQINIQYQNLSNQHIAILNDYNNTPTVQKPAKKQAVLSNLQLISSGLISLVNIGNQVGYDTNYINNKRNQVDADINTINNENIVCDTIESQYQEILNVYNGIMNSYNSLTDEAQRQLQRTNNLNNLQNNVTTLTQLLQQANSNICSNVGNINSLHIQISTTVSQWQALSGSGDPTASPCNSVATNLTLTQGDYNALMNSYNNADAAMQVTMRPSVIASLQTMANTLTSLYSQAIQNACSNSGQVLTLQNTVNDTRIQLLLLLQL